MKKRIIDLDMKRNWLEAITFYIVYLIIGVLVSSGIGAISGSMSNDSIQSGMISGVIFAGVYTAYLYFKVYKKKRMNSTLFIIFGVIATIVGFSYGMIISLVFVAVLTTRESSNQLDNTEFDI
ncbi:MAG: hypothetical protein Q8S24_12590 [Eubacteriales bacterium]|nr:hypothetical protein [Eubacteriales bacterium]